MSISRDIYRKWLNTQYDPLAQAMNTVRLWVIFKFNEVRDLKIICTRYGTKWNFQRRLPLFDTCRWVLYRLAEDANTSYLMSAD